MKKKKLTVTIREIVGVNTIRFSKLHLFACEESARQFFYSEIGAFLYGIDDIVDIYKTDTEISHELTIFCRGFYRQFTLLY